MLVHRTEKNGKPVSVTLEQEATELRPQWSQAAAAYIKEHFPELTIAKLLRSSINTSTSRPATMTINLSVLEEPEELQLPGSFPTNS